MDKIGPLTFNAARFFIGFLSIMPFALFFEKKNYLEEINNNKKLFFKLTFLDRFIFIFRNLSSTGSFTLYRCCKCSFFYNFLCSIGSNYSFFYFSEKIHWSIWPSVLFCVIGVYFLTDFSMQQLD